MQRYGPSHRGKIIQEDDQVFVLVIQFGWKGLNVCVNKLKGVFSMHGRWRKGSLRLLAFSATRTNVRVFQDCELQKSRGMLLGLPNDLF